MIDVYSSLVPLWDVHVLKTPGFCQKNVIQAFAEKLSKKLGLFWAHHFFNPQLYFVVLQKNISLLVQLKKKICIQSAFATSSQVRCILSSKKSTRITIFRKFPSTMQPVPEAFPRLTAASVCPPAVCVARIGTALKLLLVAFLWCHEGGLRVLGHQPGEFQNIAC